MVRLESLSQYLSNEYQGYGESNDFGDKSRPPSLKGYAQA
jgi:hypothetical protein